MQMKKMFGIALAAALVGSMAVVAMPVSAIEYDGEEHTLGIVPCPLSNMMAKSTLLALLAASIAGLRILLL